MNTREGNISNIHYVSMPWSLTGTVSGVAGGCGDKALCPDRRVCTQGWPYDVGQQLFFVFFFCMWPGSKRLLRLALPTNASLCRFSSA